MFKSQNSLGEHDEEYEIGSLESEHLDYVESAIRELGKEVSALTQEDLLV